MGMPLASRYPVNEQIANMPMFVAAWITCSLGHEVFDMKRSVVKYLFLVVARGTNRIVLHLPPLLPCAMAFHLFSILLRRQVLLDVPWTTMSWHAELVSCMVLLDTRPSINRTTQRATILR